MPALRAWHCSRPGIPAAQGACRTSGRRGEVTHRTRRAESAGTGPSFPRALLCRLLWKQGKVANLVVWPETMLAGPQGSCYKRSSASQAKPWISFLRAMKILAVHPSPLMYTKIFLRLEPLGIELIAAAARRAGHEVRLIDLQVEPTASYSRLVREWAPDAIAISNNYLANVPEVIDLARRPRAIRPATFVFVGRPQRVVRRRRAARARRRGDRLRAQGGRRGLAGPAARGGRRPRRAGPARGARRRDARTGRGRRPGSSRASRTLLPARDLLRHRRKYFIGVLDPCASIEFSRGCPWDCSFCSAWTFYGRSYRIKAAEAAADELASDPRAGRLHRRRRRVHPGRARHGDRRGHRPAGHPEAILPRDPRRRPAAEQGRLPVLEDARPPVHVPGRRGDRRGGAEAVPQARDALEELRGARVRPVAGDHGGDQPHRRPRRGTAASSR